MIRWSRTLQVASDLIRVHFDGGKRGCGPAAAAWADEGSNVEEEWSLLAEGGVLLPESASATDAELTAQEQAVNAALSLLQNCRVSWIAQTGAVI